MLKVLYNKIILDAVAEDVDEPNEDGIGGIVTDINDFWTDNFSWDYGR